jgi:LysR family pca operon transcriptional activator
MATGLDPRVKLRHIACFLEVARLGSVGRAAAALALTQPAVTKTIVELEGILGVTLFDRSRRPLAPTPFGAVFQRYASAGMTALGQGVQSLRRDGTAVTVTVGALPTVSARILPAAVADFTRDGAGARLRIVTGPNPYLLSQLRDGELDLVIGRMAEPDAMTGFSFEHLYSERIALIVRPDHPLRRAVPFDLAAIADHPTLMPPPGSIIRPTVERFLMAHGIGPLTREIETVSDSFARAYIRMTDAVWIISEGVAADDIAQGLLAALPADMADTLGPVGLTVRTDIAPPLAAQLFADAVRRITRTAPAAAARREAGA